MSRLAMIAAPFFILPSLFGVTFRVPKLKLKLLRLTSALLAFQQVVPNAQFPFLDRTNCGYENPRVRKRSAIDFVIVAASMRHPK
jgi:hypothetical protein